MAVFIKYTTKPGDRWDTIAWDHYRDSYAWPQIAIANPTIPLRPVLDEGLELAVPVIARLATDELSLPPWKRAQ